MPPLLLEARNDAARSVHVSAVLLSEPIEHHPLLAWHPQNVQGCKQRQTRPAGDPVLQQQSLRYASQPLGGVHRVPDAPVYASLRGVCLPEAAARATSCAQPEDGDDEQAYEDRQGFGATYRCLRSVVVLLYPPPRDPRRTRLETKSPKPPSAAASATSQGAAIRPPVSGIC